MLMEIPIPLAGLYDETWKMFADMVATRCKDVDSGQEDARDFEDAFEFMTNANNNLEAGDLVAFETSLTAANVLLTSINKC